MLALVLSLAREQWRDDGKVVTSDITVMGQKAKFTIDRGKKKLHIDQNGGSEEIDIEPGAAALLNLHWAAYGVLAQQFNGATSPTEWHTTARYQTRFAFSPGPNGAMDGLVHDPGRWG